MGAIRYTQEQQRVIDTRDANLLSRRDLLSCLPPLIHRGNRR